MVEKSLKAARRTYLADLWKNVVERNTAYSSATVKQAPNNSLMIKVNKSVTDLNRFKSLPFSTSYLYAKDQN